MYDLEKFKNGKCYIRLETQEKYNKVMKWLESKDILWSSGDTATTLNYYPNYRGNLSIVFRGGLKKDSEGFYTKYDYKELLPNKEEKEMKYKINDIVKTEFGVGKIVDVDCLEPPYLVHIDGFDGHNGSFHGTKARDNYNNWWFFEEDLELVKHNDNKYEVGDLVRVFGKGKVRRIGKVCPVFGYRLEEDINYYIDEELEPVTHLTTKDFIKEVDKLGYVVEDSYSGEYFNVMANKRDIVKIRKDKINVITTDYLHTISNDLFDLVVRYAKTPIEFREVKEYTLQCPLTSAYLCVNSITNGNTVWLHKNNFAVNKDSIPKYTQQEIDELPNQELIKVLKQEPVK